MDQDQQRDFAEEAYWRAFCPECGTSPCAVDGEHSGDDPEPVDDCAICVPGQCPGPDDCPGNYGRPDEPPPYLPSDIDTPTG
jgi:hypothetical protein